MAIIDNTMIDNIRKSVDIVDIISGYIPLTQRGKNYFGVCPFHDDHSPSMSVSKDLQIYRCFSCGATGNVIKFVMDYEHLSFKETLKLLADKAGINIEIGNIRTERKDKNKELYEIYEISRKFYQNNINTASSKDALLYLQKRDINVDIIKTFEIGLSLKKRDILTKLLISKNYNQELLQKSGLVITSKFGYNDIYYNRIMFPLHDLEGRVVGFSGRIYEGTDPSKYINTRETDIFQKGKLIYNYHLAKDECRRKNTVIIMEGFMDVIRAYTIGVKNVVATMGTAVTKEQALIIKKMAKNIILCFDGDAAGEHATLACGEELLKIGVTPKIVRLEENLDPDDYIRKYGADRFLEKINNPINIMDFKLSYYKKDHNLNSNVDMAQYVNQIIQELTKMSDDVLKELTIKKLSEESRLSEEFIRNKLNEKQSVDKKETITIKEEKKIATKYDVAQRNLIFYMLKDHNIIKLFCKNVMYMPTECYRTLSNEIKFYYQDCKEFNIADFLTRIMNHPLYESLQQTINEITSLKLKDECSNDEIEDYINTINEYTINNEVERIKKRISETNDVRVKAQLTQELVNLKLRGNNNV